MKQIICIFLLFFNLNAFSQFDSTQRALMGKFQQMKEGVIQRQADFINQNDSIFIQFLKKSWKSVLMMQGISKESKKPIEQPVLKDTKKQEESEMIEIDTTQIIDLDNTASYNNSILHFDTVLSYAAQTILQQFSFYGNKEKIYDWPSFKPSFKELNEDGIVNFYIGVTNQNTYWLNDVSLLIKLKEKYNLNDWGYYQLVKNASSALFSNTNEQRLFSWYIFLKSGYDVKVGYDQSEVFLMFPSIHKLFGRQYFIDDDAIYYLADITKTKISNLKTYDAKYPGSNKLFDFELKSHPVFEGQSIKKTLSYKGKSSEFYFEKSELDFLTSYPQCELKLYFQFGVTSENVTSLDELLIPEIKGKPSREIIDILIDFIQHTIGYATDEEQFGRERYLFAHESLFYPKNDCEDRTIFMSFLVKRYTGLNSVALDFPGHVVLAVNLPNAGNGNFISFKGEKYLVCDPTYINAKSGMIPDQYKSMKAKIVSYN